MAVALSFLFGIHYPTPIKYAWVALTLLNVALMVWLWWLARREYMGPYLFVVVVTTLLQGSAKWSLWGEAGLALFAAPWLYSLLPRDENWRFFALSIGVLVACAMMFAVPPPWPRYDPAMYFTRMYSSALFLGIAFATCLLAWSIKQKINWNAAIAVPWFMAVILAGSQRGWDRWVVGIAANVAWTACLCGWIWLSARRVPDALSDAKDPSAPSRNPAT